MSDDGDVRTMDAVQAMRDRGIDSPEYLLEHCEPAVILRTCRWWDGLKNVGPGLLVKRIKQGGVSEDQASSDGLTDKQRKLAALRAEFDRAVERFPIGSVAEAHARLIDRREPDSSHECPGDLIVFLVSEGAIEVRCDSCALETAYAPRAVRALPPGPAAIGREVPPVAERVPNWGLHAPRREDRAAGPRQLDLARASEASRERQRAAA